MTENILVAIITTIGLVIIAILDRTRRHALATRVQVENSHSTNLREESDERHAENTGRLLSIATDVTKIKGTLVDLLEADRRLSERMDVEHRRVDDLERTIPSNKPKGPSHG